MPTNSLSALTCSSSQHSKLGGISSDSLVSSERPGGLPIGDAADKAQYCQQVWILFQPARVPVPVTQAAPTAATRRPAAVMAGSQRAAECRSSVGTEPRPAWAEPGSPPWARRIISGQGSHSAHRPSVTSPPLVRIRLEFRDWTGADRSGRGPARLRSQARFDVFDSSTWVSSPPRSLRV